MLGRVGFFDGNKIRKIHVFFIIALIASIFIGFNYRVPLVCGALLGLFFILFKNNDNLLVIFNKDLVWFFSLFLWFFYYFFHAFIYGDDVSFIGRETIPLFVILFYVSLYFLSKIKTDLFLICVSVSLILGGTRTFYNAYYLDLSRPSFTYQPIIDAHIHLLGSVICLFFFKKSPSNLINFLLLFAFSVGLFSAILTETRGIYPALIFLTIMYIYKSDFLKGKNIFYFFIGGASVVFFVLSGKVGDRIVSKTSYEINEILQGNLNTSIGLRLQMWDVALRAGSENWLLGIGKSNEKRRHVTSAIIHDKNYNPELMYQHHNFHNDILDHFVKYGVVGVLLLMFVFVAPFVGLKKGWRIYISIILIVFLFAGLTVNFFEHRRAFMIYFVLVSILRYLSAVEGVRSEVIQ